MRTVSPVFIVRSSWSYEYTDRTSIGMCAFGPDIVHGQNEGPTAPASRHACAARISTWRWRTPGVTARIAARTAIAVARALSRSAATSAGDLTKRIARNVSTALAMWASGNVAERLCAQSSWSPAIARIPEGTPGDPARRASST